MKNISAPFDRKSERQNRRMLFRTPAKRKNQVQSGGFSKTAVMVMISMLLVTLLPAGGVDVHLEMASRYIWRGFDLNPDNRPVLQPSMDIELGKSGFSLNLWSSFSFIDRDLEELDLTITYQLVSSRNFDLSFGFSHYGWYLSRNFKFRDHTSQEFFVTLGLKRVPLTPAFSIYRDVSNGSGVYALCSLSQSVNIKRLRSMDVSASLGYNHNQWINDSGFSDLNFRVSMPFVFKKIIISPFVSFSFIFLKAVNPVSDREFWFGIVLSSVGG